MTENCLNTTAVPNQGEVALGYWETLLLAFHKVSDTDRHSQQFLKKTDTVFVKDYLDVFEKGLDIDSIFGLRVGQAVSLKTFPVLGMTLLSCSNLKQALTQILRYESLNHDLGSSGLSVEAQTSSYAWMPNPVYVSNPDRQLGFHLALSVFSGVKTFAPLLLQKDLPIKRVKFIASDASIKARLECFFGCPVCLGEDENSIEVDTEILDWGLAFADPTMFATLTKHAESLLVNDTSKNDFVRRVKSLLPDALSCHKFKIEDLAKVLNLSTRSIQRKLKEQGYSYQTLLDETRLQLAKVYLQEKGLSMNEIAFMIGYQEQKFF